MSKIKLYEKMVAVMTTVGQIQKDGSIEDKDGKLMYHYLSEEVTTSTLQRAFIEYGLVMFPIKVESEVVELRTVKFDKETFTPITKVIVTYKIACMETGEFEELQSIGYGSDSQDKGSNKAMTSAFKYVQRQSFMISTGEDADHTGSHELDGKDKIKDSESTTPTVDVSVPTGPKVTENQSKMLYMKHKNSAFVGMDKVCEHLGYKIKEFKDVLQKDCNGLIKLLEDNKAAA
jgi:hypothetical protein